MVVDRLPLSRNIKLPSLFPDGDYRLDIEVGGNDVLRATVMVFVTMKE